MQNMSGQEIHTEKITPLVRYFDTKNLSSSKMKSTLSVTSNCCLISVDGERINSLWWRYRGICQCAELVLACEQCLLSSARFESMYTDGVTIHYTLTVFKSCQTDILSFCMNICHVILGISGCLPSSAFSDMLMVLKCNNYQNSHCKNQFEEL